jgi:hypothetical protein
VKLVDTEETVVLVTGASLTAEERDRPVAYALKAEIDRRGVGHAYRRAVVVTDLWYLDTGSSTRIQHRDGGPGRTGVEEFSSLLLTVYSREEQVFVQGPEAISAGSAGSGNAPTVQRWGLQTQGFRQSAGEDLRFRWAFV